MPRLDGSAPAASSPVGEGAQWLASEPRPLPGLADHTVYAIALTTAGHHPEDDTGPITPADLDPEIYVADVRSTWLAGGDESWWGGPATAPTPTWPRRRDGVPLAHVLSVHLGQTDQLFEPSAYRAWGSPTRWIPNEGVLQVFSDRRSDGFAAEHGELGAWRVRWLEPAEPRALVDPPAGAQPTRAHLVNGWAGFMVPASCDLPDELPGRHAADEVNVALARAWDWQVHQHVVEHPPAFTHLDGCSSLGYQPVADHLHRVLPCGPDDRHRLVAELVPGPVLPGWFADDVHLEVWMRESDLHTRTFDRAWCLLRKVARSR